MKVNQSNNVAIQSNQTHDSQSAKRAEKLKNTPYESKSKVDSSAKNTGSVNADISSKAKEMSQAKQIASDTPDVREAKIAELREKIQSGKYNVSSQAIADRLVDDHMALSN